MSALSLLLLLFDHFPIKKRILLWSITSTTQKYIKIKGNWNHSLNGWSRNFFFSSSIKICKCAVSLKWYIWWSFSKRKGKKVNRMLWIWIKFIFKWLCNLTSIFLIEWIILMEIYSNVLHSCMSLLLYKQCETFNSIQFIRCNKSVMQTVAQPFFTICILFSTVRNASYIVCLVRVITLHTMRFHGILFYIVKQCVTLKLDKILLSSTQ